MEDTEVWKAKVIFGKINFLYSALVGWWLKLIILTKGQWTMKTKI